MEYASQQVRHAYCIIAHSDPYCLQKLIDLIDDVRNDIFILIDKKSDIRQFETIKAKFSKILYPSTQVSIYWGDASLIAAELLLFKTVLKQKTRYEYIHLLSGADLPLHDQNYIHHFFSTLPEGSNLIGFAYSEENKKDLIKKTTYRHVLLKYSRHKSFIVRNICNCIRKTWISMQRILQLKVDWADLQLAKGTEWVSITSDFAKYLVQNEQLILHKFKYVSCGDEIYKQTLLLSSKFKDTILFDSKEYKGSMRKIDWERGTPYIWQLNDFSELMESKALFARKFSSKRDKEIIEKIYSHIKDCGFSCEDKKKLEN